MSRSEASIAVHSRGLGTPVVLVHAFPADSRLFDGLGTLAGVRLITPDLPDTWQANAAELTRVDGHAAWKINFIAPGFIDFNFINFNFASWNINFYSFAN